MTGTDEPQALVGRYAIERGLGHGVEWPWYSLRRMCGTMGRADDRSARASRPPSLIATRSPARRWKPVSANLSPPGAPIVILAESAVQRLLGFRELIPAMAKALADLSAGPVV